MRPSRFLPTLSLLLLSGCLTSVTGPIEDPEEELVYEIGQVVGQGVAAWTGAEAVGRQTANGETFNPNLRTAGHRTLPFGSLIRVENLANGTFTLVRINDRGPTDPTRLINVSETAAREIDMIRAGTAHVRLIYAGRE